MYVHLMFRGIPRYTHICGAPANVHTVYSLGTGTANQTCDINVCTVWPIATAKGPHSPTMTGSTRAERVHPTVLHTSTA